MSYNEISGGVTAPQGFLAGSAYCGIKASNPDRPDIALIHSPQPTVAAATFTTNRVKAAPVRVSSQHLRSRDVRAIIANSGNANACTGLARNRERQAHGRRRRRRALGLQARQVLVCSTGRIGVPLPIEKMEATIARGFPARFAARTARARGEGDHDQRHVPQGDRRRNSRSMASRCASAASPKARA